MTDQNDQVADIAWLRNLAEDGAKTPYRGGSVLMAAGVIYGAGAVLHWLYLSGAISGDASVTGFIWMGATALFLATLTILLLRMRGANATRTTAHRVVSTVWACVGWAIFVLFASMMVGSVRMGDGQGVGGMWLVPSIIMVFYGLGWAVTASLFGNGRLWWLSIGSFIAAPALAAFAGSHDQYLAYAASLFLLMALPGYLLMRAAKRG